MVSRRRRATGPDERGFTLVEMLAAMAIFTIFVAILLTSVISIARSSGRAQLIAQSSSTVLTVFQNLDRQIRYSNAINFPGTGTSGARYIEFRTGADSSSTGLPTCTQWRFVPATKLLQVRTWQEGTIPSATWSTKISTVLDLGGATYPFQLIPATASVGGGSSMQQMVLSVSSGTDLIAAGAAISTTFVARNSSVLSPSNSSTRTPGTSDQPVCLLAGGRP